MNNLTLTDQYYVAQLLGKLVAVVASCGGPEADEAMKRLRYVAHVLLADSDEERIRIDEMFTEHLGSRAVVGDDEYH